MFKQAFCKHGQWYLPCRQIFALLQLESHPPLYTFLPNFNLNQIRTFWAKIATKISKIILLIIKIDWRALDGLTSKRACRKCTFVNYYREIDQKWNFFFSQQYVYCTLNLFTINSHVSGCFIPTNYQVDILRLLDCYQIESCKNRIYWEFRKNARIFKELKTFWDFRAFLWVQT